MGHGMRHTDGQLYQTLGPGGRRATVGEPGSGISGRDSGQECLVCLFQESTELSVVMADWTVLEVVRRYFLVCLRL